MAGLSITYALQITGFLNWVVRMGTQAEAQMNAGTSPQQAMPARRTIVGACADADMLRRSSCGSVRPVERIVHYSSVENEAPWIIETRRPPHGWPTRAGIVMVWARTAPPLLVVARHASC